MTLNQIGDISRFQFFSLVQLLYINATEADISTTPTQSTEVLIFLCEPTSEVISLHNKNISAYLWSNAIHQPVGQSTFILERSTFYHMNWVDIGSQFSCISLNNLNNWCISYHCDRIQIPIIMEQQFGMHPLYSSNFW